VIGELGESLYVIPYVRVPDKYHGILFSGVTCCILGLAAYDANLFTTYVMSGVHLYIVSSLQLVTGTKFSVNALVMVPSSLIFLSCT